MVLLVSSWGIIEIRRLWIHFLDSFRFWKRISVSSRATYGLN